MPHIILDCPRSLTGIVDFGVVLDGLHAAIGREPSVRQDDVKSRVHLVDHWRNGDGGTDGGVVHARVVLTRPRSEAQRTSIAILVLEGLRATFSRLPVSLQLCVELTVVPDGHYVKTTAPALLIHPTDETTAP